MSGGVAVSQTDFDGDGDVDFADFLSFARAYGSKQGEANYDAKFDLSDNNEVDFNDFLLFARNYGKSS